jgi:hypothetical protein
VRILSIKPIVQKIWENMSGSRKLGSKGKAKREGKRESRSVQYRLLYCKLGECGFGDISGCLEKLVFSQGKTARETQ